MAAVGTLKPQRVGFYKYHDVILGKGNFATVYLARHKIIGCEVALKVINTDNIAEEYVFRNLEREARILKDLHHPNIIRLYETVKSVNLYCLSLERIRGVNLYQYIVKQENRRIPEKLARVFFHQMLSAVQYMHHLQVIHRDLKLENILVEFGHVIKIIDFGLSNIYYPCVRLRTHCGSVEYAAPELFKSISTYGLAVDMWSLGVILYTMVVGQMPFPFNRDRSYGNFRYTREHFLQRISKGLMQENWELMEGLSPDCWKLLHDLLEPDQFRRIRIEDAIKHHWIRKDEYLKKRLPQKRRDLQRKFRGEIVEYLSDLLRTPKEEIEKFIYAGHYNNSIACMFYIIRDILVKEVLYPPKNFATTFLYRMECWKKSRTWLYPMQQSAIKDGEKTKVNEESEIYYSTIQPPTAKINETEPSLKIHSEISQADATKLHSQKKATDTLKTSNVCKENSVSEACRNSVAFSKIDANHKEGEKSAEQTVSRYRYRSYESSRPKVIKAKDSTNKTRQNIPELKHNERRRSDDLMKGKARGREYSSSNHERSTNNREFKTEKKDYAKSHCENSFNLTSDVSNGQPTSLTYTKLQSPISKTPIAIKGLARKLSSANICTTADSSIGGGSALKKIESPNNETEIIKILLKNSTPKEAESKKVEEKRAPVLTKAPRISNEHNRIQGLKIAHSGALSRIPIKNMRYGPPGPFSHSIHAINTVKFKRTTVADRIHLCSGDSNENVGHTKKVSPD